MVIPPSPQCSLEEPPSSNERRYVSSRQSWLTSTALRRLLHTTDAAVLSIRWSYIRARFVPGSLQGTGQYPLNSLHSIVHQLSGLGIPQPLLGDQGSRIFPFSCAHVKTGELLFCLKMLSVSCLYLPPPSLPHFYLVFRFVIAPFVVV